MPSVRNDPLEIDAPMSPGAYTTVRHRLDLLARIRRLVQQSSGAPSTDHQVCFDASLSQPLEKAHAIDGAGRAGDADDETHLCCSRSSVYSLRRVSKQDPPYGAFGGSTKQDAAAVALQSKTRPSLTLADKRDPPYERRDDSRRTEPRPLRKAAARAALRFRYHRGSCSSARQQAPCSARRAACWSESTTRPATTAAGGTRDYGGSLRPCVRSAPTSASCHSSSARAPSFTC